MFPINNCENRVSLSCQKFTVHFSGLTYIPLHYNSLYWSATSKEALLLVDHFLKRKSFGRNTLLTDRQQTFAFLCCQGTAHRCTLRALNFPLKRGSRSTKVDESTLMRVQTFSLVWLPILIDSRAPSVILDMFKITVRLFCWRPSSVSYQLLWSLILFLSHSFHTTLILAKYILCTVTLDYEAWYNVMMAGSSIITVVKELLVVHVPEVKCTQLNIQKLNFRI